MSQRYLGGIITANPTTPTLSSASGVWTLEQDFQNSAAITPQVIGRSVRLRSSASAYFNRTPASAGSRTTWTWSGWVKRGSLGTGQTIFGRDQNGSGQAFAQLNFNSSDQLNFINYSTTTDNVKTSTQVFRDPSAWYHIVCVFNSGNATAADRIQLYVNGQRITAFASSTDPSLNYNGYINESGLQHNIGSILVSSRINYVDGYLTEVNFIDGQALTPSSFGAFDSNGIWQPLSYRGTYGTNGFYLNFSDNSAATAAAIGKDYSGNGNNWTPNNISVTAGVTYDSMLDSPTNSPDGGNGRGNYCVLNGANNGYGTTTLSQGNLYSVISAPGATEGMAVGTIGMTTGKWYWEVNLVSANTTYSYPCSIGIGNLSTTTGVGMPNTSYAYNSKDGNKLSSTGSFVSAAYGASYTASDVIGVAFDADAGTLTFYKNNTSQGTAFTGIASSTWFARVGSNDGCTTAFNFGQRPFAYTPPTGFKALNTQNLPAVNINNGAQYMNAVTYTGNSGSQTVSNGVFQPDLTWHKTRSVVASHVLFDSIRGASSGLNSDATSAQNNNWTGQSFTSTGFTVSNSYSSESNYNGQTMVAWQWKAAGSSVSNTSGSITSTVNAGTTQGFSVVTFTSSVNGTPTIGHGLGVAPSMIITKSRSSTDTWLTYHASLGATKGIALQTTGAAVTSANYWNNTAPTSSVFTINATASGNFYNTSQTYVAYCFAQVAGYSAFGTYTGNGSADGPFVYTGFRPRYIMWKRTDSISDWSIIDSSRSTYNVQNDELYADLSSAETAAGAPRLDNLSNGFKIRNAGGAAINASGGTYIYAAFAENPFNIARAR
jgi:hypothetical protein